MHAVVETVALLPFTCCVIKNVSLIYLLELVSTSQLLRGSLSHDNVNVPCTCAVHDGQYRMWVVQWTAIGGTLVGGGLVTMVT